MKGKKWEWWRRGGSSEGEELGMVKEERWK